MSSSSMTLQNVQYRSTEGFTLNKETRFSHLVNIIYPIILLNMILIKYNTTRWLHVYMYIEYILRKISAVVYPVYGLVESVTRLLSQESGHFSSSFSFLTLLNPLRSWESFDRDHICEDY